MMMLSDTLADAVHALGENVTSSFAKYFAVLVSLSASTMALIEAAKNLLPLRRWFQRYRLLRWLKRHKQGKMPVCQAEKVLIRLAADEDLKAFYNSEIDDLYKEMSAAIQILIDYPDESPELLKWIVSSKNNHLIDLILAASEPREYPLHNDDIKSVIPTAPSYDRHEIFDARNRIKAFADQAIMAFKISTANAWKRDLHILSYVISVIIVIIALSRLNQGKNIIGILITAAIAGFLAPVARDILAAIQKLRE